MITQPRIPNNPLEKHVWTWQGHSIQYTVQGTGQPLLLIHGFGASIGHWRKNIPVLADAGYRVFAIDLLGFGGSDKPALNYSLEVWQEQIKDFWDAHIQEPTVFIGNSIGALLSLMVVTQDPDIAVGGVLINCAGGLNHRPDELNLPLRLVMGTFNKLVSSKTVGPFLFNRIRQKNRIRNTLRQVYCDPAAITEELVDLLYQPSCDPGAQQVFASVLTGPAGPAPGELLPKLNRPLLVLWGENDPWTPINGAAIYQQQRQMEKDVEFFAIPQAGHCPHDEKPDRVNSLILDWLSQQYSSTKLSCI
ncbi:MAG: alpha/beta fold hydrolase [Coleofasciculus sp. D1-CHI-01]|uniref:alpha/beta fold hydrolase n=1 Tax=Coleofasciculus sp. D1-CHI-01 TaxID=3068482 RepID=UPI0032F1386F